MSSVVANVTGKNVAKEATYPPALATHEDVVRDPTLFLDTLRSFHSEMGTKFMVPVIGGKDLNLHILYVEVTKRGGFEKVVSDKKWREISSIFNLSSTTTSASYALKKHYFSNLHSYEQVYFLKHQGPQTMEVTGTIEKKCDCGYLVSMPIGGQVLKGIIYFPDHHSSSSNHINSTSQQSTAMVPYVPPTDPIGEKKRRKRRKRGGEPGRPKPNRSGYNFFFQKKHAMLKTQHPEKEREFTKMIGEAWNGLGQEEKMVYQQKGVEDKERYQRELKAYRDGSVLGQQAGASLPVNES